MTHIHTHKVTHIHTQDDICSHTRQHTFTHMMTRVHTQMLYCFHTTITNLHHSKSCSFSMSLTNRVQFSSISVNFCPTQCQFQLRTLKSHLCMLSTQWSILYVDYFPVSSIDIIFLYIMYDMYIWLMK